LQFPELGLPKESAFAVRPALAAVLRDLLQGAVRDTLASFAPTALAAASKPANALFAQQQFFFQHFPT
jgi:hypothetical protein